MALLSIDELNTPNVEVEPPERYFSRMAISKEQKEERVDTANEIMDVLLFFFALLAIEMQENNPDYDMVLRKFRIRFADVVASHSRMDDHQNAYVDEFTQNQLDVTRRHMEAVGVGVDGQTDAGWWSSPDRATAIGEDAANTILNYEELMKAAEAGAVGKKWVDRDDGRVRKTHKEVTKRIIPLAEYFAVGNGVMLYPCDWDNNPDECHRCRCSCHYYDKDGKVVKIVAHYNGQVVNAGDYSNGNRNVYDSNIDSVKNGEPIVITDNKYVHTDGTEYVVDGKHVVQTASDDEIETAKIMARTYGYDVHLVPRVLSPQHIKTPDYIMNNVRIDRKMVNGNGKNVLDNAVKEKREQANEFIFVIAKTELSVEEIVEQANKIFGNPYRDFVKKIYIQKDQTIIREMKRE